MTDLTPALAREMHDRDLIGVCFHQETPVRAWDCERIAGELLAALPPGWCGCDLTTAHMVGEQRGRDAARAEIACLRKIEAGSARNGRSPMTRNEGAE